MQQRPVLTRKLQSAQTCRACGEVIYGGQPAYRYLIKGRTYYHHAGLDACRPLAFELEDDPEVGQEMRELPWQREELAKRNAQLAELRGQRERENAGKTINQLRQERIAELRTRYPHREAKPND